MCDPELDRKIYSGEFYSRDYYPHRYTGTRDYGGVHLNSGIANLGEYTHSCSLNSRSASAYSFLVYHIPPAACLMVKGGTHPRGKTTIDVPAIVGGYDTLGSIFYQANTNCLTPFSNFAAARFCTADVFGGINKANVHLAQDAVGVPNDPPTPPPPPIPFTVNASGTGTFANQIGTKGELHQYTMHIGEGSTITCSTKCNNGDADLFLRFGAVAIPNFYSEYNACTSGNVGSNESCTTGRAPSGGTLVYVGVHAYESYTGLKVTCQENRPLSTLKPTTMKPTTLKPTTMKPTTSKPKTAKPTTMKPTTLKPTTSKPTTMKPTTMKPTTLKPTTFKKPVTLKPSTMTTMKPTTTKSTTMKPTS